jgi:hypothetical protein
MKMFIEIILVLLLMLGVSVLLLRMRKLRRDKFRSELSALDPRLVVPPPPPYQVAPGFRVLPEDVKEIQHRIPEKPKLDTSSDGFVFNDNQAAPLSEDEILSHREQHVRTLAQSFEKSPLSFTTVGSMVIAAMVIVVFVFYYFH